MKLNYLLLTLATLLCLGATGRAEAPDSVTVTVAWTLTNTTSNKDALNHFLIYNDAGFYRLFKTTDLNKFASAKKMDVRVPRQGHYTMMMVYTNKRPAYFQMKKIIVRENVELSGDSTLEFKGSMCTRHLGINYRLPDGQIMSFNSNKNDYTGANAQQALMCQRIILRDQPQYQYQYMLQLKNGNTTLGNDIDRCSDIYFNPGISDKFLYITGAIVQLLDTADTVGHGVDKSQPIVLITQQHGLNTTEKNTEITNPGKYRVFTPDTIKQSLYPVKNAKTRWSYKFLYRDPYIMETAWNIISGAIENPEGRVAYDLAPGDFKMFATLYQLETTKVRMGSVDSGSGIAHLSAMLTAEEEPYMSLENNIGQGYNYNCANDDHHLVVIPHPFYSYTLGQQTPEHGNSAPFFAFTYMPSGTSTMYKYHFPMNGASNGDWVGNGGERRCVDLFSKGFAVIAGGDTIATEWAKMSSSLQAFEKTAHDPADIKIILDNTNFTVDSLQGHSRAEFIWHENDGDVIPPTLTMLQLRTKAGRITNHFEKLSDVDIYFNAADYYRPSEQWYQLLSNPCTVKAEIASRGSERFTELRVLPFTENSMMPIWGDGYKIDLSPYDHKNRDGWFQLRLTLTDATGNRNVQTISPALYARQSACGVESGYEEPFGMELYGTTLTLTGIDSAAVEVYNMSGMRVFAGRGHDFDLSALPSGLYLVRATGSAGTATRKLRL